MIESIKDFVITVAEPETSMAPPTSMIAPNLRVEDHLNDKACPER